MTAELDNNDREELENLKTENARLSELVKVLEEQIESLNTRLRTRLRLERELFGKVNRSLTLWN